MTPEGLKELRDSVRQSPSDAGAWFELGEAALAASEVGEARFAFTQAAYLAPHDVPQAIRAADHLASAKCFGEAEHILRRVLEREPDHKEVTVRLATLLLDTGRESQAEGMLATLAESHPRDIDLRLLVATACQRHGALDKASGHLKAALALEPDHPEANRHQAEVLALLGDTAGAVRCWRRIVMRTKGQDLDALTGLGISLSGDGQHTQAIQILQEVARRNTRSAAALGDLGMAFLSAGDMQRAVDTFKRALQIEPRSAQAYCGLGIAYERERRWHEAAQAFRATEQLAPESPTGPLNLGLALRELGDREGARRALLRAAALDPNDPEIQTALEVVFAQETSEPPSAEAPREGRQERQERRRERAPTPVPATPTPAPHRFDASITGDLKSFQLFDVLEFLRLQNKTGALVVSSRQGAGIVRLHKGAVTGASAPGVRRLGATLVDRGVLTQDTLDRALSHQKRDAHDNAALIGSILLRHKLVEQSVLAAAIEEQVLAALGDMLTWPEGAFSFHASAEQESPPVALDLQEVMLQLMRLSDEKKAGRGDS